MDEVQEAEGQERPEADEMESDGVSDDVGLGQDGPGTQDADGSGWANDPLKVKKRLGMQAKRHQREMRQMQEQIMRMQQHIAEQGRNTGHYSDDEQSMYSGASEDERIQHAVRAALAAKDQQEQQRKEAENQAHIQRQYQKMVSDFDKASDRYEDFDEVVTENHDAPFTATVRDALLLVDNPADVAYKLAKNRPELERIAKLPPLQQVREVNRLSFALMGGNTGKQAASQRHQPIGNIRHNPASTSHETITDKTPPSVIRARMKAGTWK